MTKGQQGETQMTRILMLLVIAVLGSSGHEITVLHVDSVSNQTNTFKHGDICTMSTNEKYPGEIDIFEIGRYSVRAVARGSPYARGSDCPQKVDTALTLEQFESLKRFTEERFTRSIVQQSPK
jgi:hypothetical protein